MQQKLLTSVEKVLFSAKFKTCVNNVGYILQNLKKAGVGGGSFCPHL